jgi:hypothetical protein
MKPQANADDLAAHEQRRLNEARNLAAGILNDLKTGEPEGTAAAPEYPGWMLAYQAADRSTALDRTDRYSVAQTAGLRGADRRA